jgi:hypothetical protein
MGLLKILFDFLALFILSIIFVDIQLKVETVR